MTILELLRPCSECNDTGILLIAPPGACREVYECCSEEICAYRKALRRIATDFAPGDEPMLGDYQGPSGTPEPGRFLLAHGRWQALTEVQAAILEELQR